MSEPKTHAALGLGDTNVDPDILTKEIDHDFFDDPLGVRREETLRFATCQANLGNEMKILNKMPNEEITNAMLMTEDTSSSDDLLRMRLAREEGLLEGAIIIGGVGEGYHEDSGRSSSNTTVHLELGKDGREQTQTGAGVKASEDFYSIQSNANYPRPKESYQLQQRRRSFGNIQQPQRNNNGESGNGEQSFQPLNPTDCGLNGHYGDLNGSDTSSSSGDDDGDQSDSDLSDSSESELESLDTDDEEFVDMLEKYFDYIDPDSDCSDLTEVSPLSSLAVSPLPPSFFTGMELNAGEIYHEQGTEEQHMDHHDLNILTNDQLCLATGALKINDTESKGNGDKRREPQDTDFSSTAEIDVAVAAVTAVASAVPAAAQLFGRDLLRGGKPRLPLVISTTETVIIPQDESDDDNNAPGSMSISGGGTCCTSIGIEGVEDVENDPEESKGEFGERDPARDKKELDVCFNCCVMEHAKKILSREASPSRKHNGWLVQSKQKHLEEGNGNSGGNGNNGDEIGRAIGNDGESRARGTWNGKMRAGSSTSATSSSSSTTGSSSTNTFSSGASGSTSGSGFRKAQKNFTFTPEQMRKIERENHILLRKILDTHQKGFHHGHHGNHCHHHRCRNHGHHHHSSGHHGHIHHHQNRGSSISIPRLRQQKRIEQENAILMKKLQNVKPSKEIGDAFGKAVKN